MRITRIQVSQLDRSLHDSPASISHGWVYAAVHGCHSPCASAIGRAITRFDRNPCALGLERFQTHVTLPHPWLSLAPTTSRSRERQPRMGQSDVCLEPDRKSTRLNSSHLVISYAVFCLKKKKKQ